MRNHCFWLFFILAASFLILNCTTLPGGPGSITEDVSSFTLSHDAADCPRPAQSLPGSLPNASQITVFNKKDAEYFIAPSGVNVPSDVVVMENGDILVAASRMNAVLKIARDGKISTFANLMVYSIDRDAKGNLYGYMFPGGEVFRINSTGKSQVIARVAQSACESTMAVAPDGTIYIGLNECGGSSNSSGIHRITRGSSQAQLLARVTQGNVMSLDVNGEGRLFAITGKSLNEVDTENGNMQRLADLADMGSFHGLVASDSGDFYYSSGDFHTSGSLYRITPEGQVKQIAAFENNGLEGLALTAQGELVGVQRAIGGVQLVRADGSVQELVKPNGLTTPQSLAVSQCGELFIVNDESGQMTAASMDGMVRPFVKLISFQPPQTFIAAAPDGSLIAGESAPGFPSEVNRYLPDGKKTIITSQIAWVSGVAIAADGFIFVSATGDGQIIRILPNGERKTYAEGLRMPQCLALGGDGTLYAVIGGREFGEVFSIPLVGDALQSISAEGKATTLAQIPNIAQIVFGPDGLLYAAAGREVYRVYANKKVEKVASGFQSARGVAFDREGNLFIADENENSIILIRAKYLSPK